MPIPEYVRILREKVGHDFLILPGVCAIIINAAGEVMLNRRTDTGKWATIGGTVEPDEQPADAMIREVFEETGVTVAIERIVSVSTAPRATLPNGDVVQYVLTTFRCRPIAGEARVNDDESFEVRYFPIDDLPPLRPEHLQRIKDALA